MTKTPDSRSSHQARPRVWGRAFPCLLILLLGSGCGAPNADESGVSEGKRAQETELLPLTIGEHAIRVEVADTVESRGRGLMFRHVLPMDQGMLFVYPRPHRLSFWMQNTLIPLDIAFIDGSGFIIAVESMSPLDEDATVAPAPVPYALEMNAGWFEAHDLGPGDRVEGLPNWRRVAH